MSVTQHPLLSSGRAVFTQGNPDENFFKDVLITEFFSIFLKKLFGDKIRLLKFDITT